MRRWFDVSTSLFHHIICMHLYDCKSRYFLLISQKSTLRQCDISLQYQLKTHTHTSIHQPISPHPNVFLIENSQSLLLYHNYAIFLPSSQFILRYWYVTSMRPKPC